MTKPYICFSRIARLSRDVFGVLRIAILGSVLALSYTTDATAVERIFRDNIIATGHISRSFPETTCTWSVTFTGEATLTLVEGGGNAGAGSTLRVYGPADIITVSGSTPSFTCNPGSIEFNHTVIVTGVSNLGATFVFGDIFHATFQGSLGINTVSGSITVVYDIPSGAQGSVVTIPLNLTEALVPPLSVTKKSQGDSSWATANYDGPCSGSSPSELAAGTCKQANIRSKGCALTTIAMLVELHTGGTWNPPDVDSYLSQHNGYNDTGRIQWYGVPDDIKLVARKKPSTTLGGRTEIDRLIEAELAAGNPVLVKVPGNVNPNADHFVVIKGIGSSSDGRRTYTIADPGTSKTNIRDGYDDVIREVYFFHPTAP